ncbi:MAG: hypothetical protein IJ039_01425, partial [Clostridia bacterium]|nr:hypothetical protein [Clostridia bacterium]
MNNTSILLPFHRLFYLGGGLLFYVAVPLPSQVEAWYTTAFTTKLKIWLIRLLNNTSILLPFHRLFYLGGGLLFYVAVPLPSQVEAWYTTAFT